jgi:hypothetical protein
MKRKNHWVAARSGEATLEFDEATQQSIESPRVGDSFSFRKRQQSATATHISFLVFSHATQQHRLTAGVCWKKLIQGAGVLAS